MGEALCSSRRINRLITLLLIPLVPFLPVRDDFHPKCNQARQKLAMLPTSRFKDLSSDVFYELSRRYPEFKEQVRPLVPASVISCSHTTLRLAFRTNPSTTHRRSTQISPILPRCRHSTALSPRKSPAGSHLKIISIWGDSEAPGPRVPLVKSSKIVRIGNFSLIGPAGPSVSQLRAMETFRVPPVRRSSQIRAPSLRRRSRFHMTVKSGTVRALR